MTHRNQASMAWHYTNSVGIGGILSSGTIRPSVVDLGPHEKPIVWFSTNQSIELTMMELAFQAEDGRYIRPKTLHEYRVLGFGIYRIGAPVAQLLRYVDLLSAAKIGLTRRRKLESVARQVGATPYEWMGQLQPLQVTEATPIEQFDGNSWRTADISAGDWLPVVMDEMEKMKPLAVAMIHDRKRSDPRPTATKNIFRPA